MAKKKIGQNFLIDQQVAEREVQYVNPDKEDVVLEIGPGKGVLTIPLAEKVKKVIAVEIDSQLVKKLKTTLPDNVTLINADVLKIDFNTLPIFNKIVSNLPFQISSPITFKLLAYPFSKAILIYQKDFAERMVAISGSKQYSRLSVGIYYKTHCRILEIVPKEFFYPVPKVDSCIVELIPREKPPFDVTNEQFFFDMTKKLFSLRRKKIKNILKDVYGKLENHPYIDKRVEELTPQQIGELSNFLFKMNP
ncbi:MAG: ribosomal RNA small subunit methyltransferase A [Thermoplasmatales archaeon]|nr:MAG: ribosomal RNA small subunit methyltransferase A [Thermoplasmatales archaeon]